MVGGWPVGVACSGVEEGVALEELRDRVVGCGEVRLEGVEAEPLAASGAAGAESLKRERSFFSRA